MATCYFDSKCLLPNTSSDTCLSLKGDFSVHKHISKTVEWQLELKILDKQ